MPSHQTGREAGQSTSGRLMTRTGLGRAAAASASGRPSWAGPRSQKRFPMGIVTADASSRSSATRLPARRGIQPGGVALVTGASSGIGAAVADCLAADGPAAPAVRARPEGRLQDVAAPGPSSEAAPPRWCCASRPGDPGRGPERLGRRALDAACLVDLLVAGGRRRPLRAVHRDAAGPGRGGPRSTWSRRSSWSGSCCRRCWPAARDKWCWWGRSPAPSGWAGRRCTPRPRRA